MDTQALVSEIVETVFVGQTGTSNHRSRVLKHLQIAEDEICAMQPWWFMEADGDLPFTAADREYTLSDDIAEVLDVYNQYGTALSGVPKRTWKHLYSGDGAAAVDPQAWCYIPGSSAADRILQISVWPTPTADSTGSTRHRLKSQTLVDSASNYSRLPELYRPLLRMRTWELIATDDENVNIIATVKQDKEALLAALLADQQRRVKVG